MTIREIAVAIGAEPPGDPADSRAVSGVSTDSRTVRPGECFFALSGPNYDGGDFISEAFRRGAVCAVAKSAAADNARILRVGEPLAALGRLAAFWRDRLGFKVAAVTGSVGKTTTKHIISHVLRVRFNVHASPKNYNNRIGLPLTLLAAAPGHEIAVVEMGSSFPGEIATLSSIARPDAAAVTGVCCAHLDGFGGLEAIVEEKLSITAGLRAGGVVFLNGDQPILVRAARNAGLSFGTFGFSRGCDYRITDLHLEDGMCLFKLGGRPAVLPLAGRGAAADAAAAWAVCDYFGISPETFIEAIALIDPLPMRAAVSQLDKIVLIDDCYNANPASMKNAVEIISNWRGKKGGGRLVFICGRMAELGESEESLHAELGRLIAASPLDVLVVVGRVAGLAEAARAKAGLTVETFENVVSACNGIGKLIKDNDVVLVKASRSAGLEAIVEQMRLARPPSGSTER